MKRRVSSLLGDVKVVLSAVFVGYNADTDTLTFKCPECGSRDTCQGCPSSYECVCKQCGCHMSVYDHKYYADGIREEKRRKKRIAENVIPFIVSFSTVLVSHIFLESPLNLRSWIILTVIGGFAFSVGYVILKNWGK